MTAPEPPPSTLALPLNAANQDTRGYVGQVLDARYRIERLIGQGGMGSVYQARHVAIGRALAVKILDPRHVGDGQGSRRLFREAQTAAAIGHPSIIEVLDVGTTARGDPYLVMECLVGEDLASLIKRHGPISVATAIAILEPVLLGLQAAHARGIVHRDVKPSNIFLVQHAGAAPAVKLIDFGIAKTLEPNPEGKITLTGASLGTPSYMSPEQAVGLDELDARVDLYATGIIFYELVTGRLPFYGANYNELLHRIARDEVPCPEMPDEKLPESVCAVIQRATRKIATERYQTASAMLEALRGLEAYSRRERALTELASLIASVVPSFQPSAGLGETPPHGSLETSGHTKLSSQDSTPLDPLRDASVTLTCGTTSASTAGILNPRVGLVIVGGGLVVAGMLAVLGMTFASPRALEAVETAEAGTEPSPLAPRGGSEEGVEITIEGAPDSARIRYDRTPIASPTFRVRRSRLVTPVEIEAEGYQPFITSIVPHQDTKVRVRLEPLPASRAAPESAARAAETAPSAATGEPKSRPPAREPTRPVRTPSTSLGKLGRDTYYTDKFE